MIKKDQKSQNDQKWSKWSQYSRLLNNRASTEHVFRQFSTKHALITELHDYTFLSRGGKKIYRILFQRKLFTKNIFKTNKIVFWLPFCIKNTEVYSVPKYVLRTFTNCPLYREVENPDSMY